MTECCPQLVDPALDFTVFMLLRGLKPSRDFQMGMKLTRKLLSDRREAKPLLLVVCTDAFGSEMAYHLADLRSVSMMAGVPVVHALARRALGEACGMRHGLTVVAIVSTPDEPSSRMLCAVMCKAAEAYAGYQGLLVQPPPATAQQLQQLQQFQQFQQLQQQVQQVRQVQLCSSPAPPPSHISFCELPCSPFVLPLDLTSSLSNISLS